MGMSGAYGPADRSKSIATIHAALDAGVTLLDTGDFYGMGHNEMLVGEAIKGHSRENLLLSVKFGVLRDVSSRSSGLDCRPTAVKNFVAYSLTRLGVDYIDIYRPARLDPDVPIEDTIGAIAYLVKAGYVRHIGLSEVDSGTIDRAAATHPIVDLQVEYSLITWRAERDILATCRRHGIGITAYGVLARGLISGHWVPDANKAAEDARWQDPRFQVENAEKNLALVDTKRKLAEAKGVTVAQIDIAWESEQGRDFVTIVGARRTDSLDEMLGALTVDIDAEDFAEIERVIGST